jgi:phosphohistidine phosphatase
MKRLLILRHGKSSWKHPDRTDHDRPLNKRGRRDAPRMGAWIAERRLTPDLIVSSTARRARKTASEVARASGCERPVALRDALYMAGPATLLDALHDAPDDCETVMLVGHNPGVEELASLLAGRSVVMPTAALAHIRLDIERWCELDASSRGELVAYQKPRELPDAGAA